MLYQPIYEPTSQDGMVFFTGNTNQFFSHNPILQETCKRMDLMTTCNPRVHAMRFFVQFPYGYGVRECEEKILQFFNVLEFPGQLNDIVFHHVWVKEDSIIGRPTYHVLALINSPYPGSDDEFMDEVDSCWKWILGDHTADSVSWCYLDAEGEDNPTSSGSNTRHLLPLMQNACQRSLTSGPTSCSA